MQAMVPVLLGATFANNCEADLAAEAESVSKDFKWNQIARLRSRPRRLRSRGAHF